MKLEITEIDWAATRERLEIINIGAWSRRNGHCAGMVRRVINENYPHLGKKYIQVLEDLRRDGFLVETEKQAA